MTVTTLGAAPRVSTPAELALLDLDRLPQRVTVLTGSYGRGHDAAAEQVATRLVAAGCEVRILDIVELLPFRLGRLLRAAYYAQLRVRPGSWDTLLRGLEQGRVLHRLAVTLLGLAAATVARAIGAADLVITTHPFGSQVLGQARRTGRLTIPAVTFLVDPSVHALWVNPGIDLHLGVHEIATAQARALGVRATTIAPVVGPVADGSVDPLAGLGLIGPRVLVTGGSLAVGELEATVREVLAAGRMTPVVLCGTNAVLRAKLADTPGVVALGWREDVAELLASSDCVIQNAGGFTALEALASGTPVVSYRPLPGHGVTNCANLEEAGLVPWARDPRQLRDLLGLALARPRHSRLPAGAPSLLDALAGDSLRTRLDAVPA